MGNSRTGSSFCYLSNKVCRTGPHRWVRHPAYPGKNLACGWKNRHGGISQPVALASLEGSLHPAG